MALVSREFFKNRGEIGSRSMALISVRVESIGTHGAL